jgi:V/A-type H+-transporting ATPase subunit A
MSAERVPDEHEAATGELVRVAGPVVMARGLEAPRLYDVVEVGERRLLGEVIRLDGPDAVVQVYEDTTGLRTGEPVRDTGRPLEVELGPGLLGRVFDGVQRPLAQLAADSGSAFIPRGASAPALDRAVTFPFTAAVDEGDVVDEGALLGTVPEGHLEHRVLVPPGMGGRVTKVASGDIGADDPVVFLDGEPLPLAQRWPVRRARPTAERLSPTTPLITGQRALDTFAPIARGASAAIPGGFGTGKTVLEQSLARWLDADVIIYVGCGERGNELTEVLEEFPALKDPRTGGSVMDRLILVANTSNMPVAAREASIYTGITLAEYYRDQGYAVAVMADSTSRWGEALREVSSRLEEMPGDEGYPAHLGSRLAEVYERAGPAVTLDGEREGSVSLIGAVSPPGGDFSEPLTQYTLRLVGTFWALDTELARRRHFPALNLGASYSLHDLDDWFCAEVAADWDEQRAWARALLQRDDELQGVVRLLGASVLAAPDKLVLQSAQRLREDFLQQSAFDEVDAFCPLEKQYWMLWALRRAHEACDGALTAAKRDADAVLSADAGKELGRMREWPADETEARARALVERLTEEVDPR